MNTPQEVRYLGSTSPKAPCFDNVEKEKLFISNPFYLLVSLQPIVLVVLKFFR